MYKYSYIKNFDQGCKIVTQIGVEPTTIDSGLSVSLNFSSQLTATQKSNLDQVMTDRGYSYIDMVTGGTENYILAVSPNGTMWKLSVNDLGVVLTEPL